MNNLQLTKYIKKLRKLPLLRMESPYLVIMYFIKEINYKNITTYKGEVLPVLSTSLSEELSCFSNVGNNLITHTLVFIALNVCELFLICQILSHFSYIRRKRNKLK